MARRRSMRRMRLLAVGVLVAGLQAPVCALACLAPAAPPEARPGHGATPHCAQATAGAAASPDAAGATDSPGSTTSTGSTGSTGPHAACGCGELPEALAAATLVEAPAPALVGRVAAAPCLPRGRAALAPPAETDLPPPDLLLLEQTLLL